MVLLRTAYSYESQEHIHNTHTTRLYLTPYTSNTDDASTIGLGRKTSRRGPVVFPFHRRHTSGFTGYLYDEHILAMSFRAPISKQHSRLAPAWSTLLDPPQLPRAVALPLCVVNIFLPGKPLPLALPGRHVWPVDIDTRRVGRLRGLLLLSLVRLWSDFMGVWFVQSSFHHLSAARTQSAVRSPPTHSSSKLL